MEDEGLIESIPSPVDIKIRLTSQGYRRRSFSRRSMEYVYTHWLAIAAVAISLFSTAISLIALLKSNH